MEVALHAISKQCSEIIGTSYIKLPLKAPIAGELYDAIYDLYPTLDTTQYKVYWRYSKTLFYRISNLLSYLTVLSLMVDKHLFLVLDDCDEHCEENEAFLWCLDRRERKEKEERERNIYDVKIIRPGEEEVESVFEERLFPRTDADIIMYAIKKWPEPRNFTADLVFKFRIVDTLQLGWPKSKQNRLVPVEEEVIERTVEKGGKASTPSSKKK